MSLRPIFIGGCERSGTTFLGALLGAAPGAVTVPESLFRRSGMRAMCEGKSPEEALTKMVRHERFRPWRTIAPLAEVVPAEAEFRDLMKMLVCRYAEIQGAKEPSIWVDHSPCNMRHGLLSVERFPEAHFIHLVRDGRAVAASVMPLAWGPNVPHVAARYWVERVAYGLALETSCLAARTIRVRYEDLLTTPEPTLRRICEFCDLEFTPQMLHGGRFEVPTFTQHQHGLVGKPPEANRATAWERDLTPRQIEIFESVAGEFLAILGYTPHYGILAKAMSKEERVWLATTEFVRRRVINPARKRWRAYAQAKRLPGS